MAPLKLVFAILSRRPRLLAAVVSVSLVASLAEGLGLGLIIGLLPGGSLGDPMRGLLERLALVPDAYGQGDALARLRVAAIVLCLTMLVRGLFYYASRLLTALMEVGVVHDLRSRIFHQILALEAGHVHAQTSGQLFARLISHTDNAGLMMRDAAKAIADVFTIGVYVVVLLLVSWPLTLGTIVLLATLTVTIRCMFGRGLTHVGERVARTRETVESLGLEGLAGLELIQLYERQADVERRFALASRAHTRALMHRSLLVNLSRPMFVTANGLGLSLLILVGVTMFPAQAEQWVSYAMLLLAIAFRLMSPAAALSEAHNVVQTLAPSLDAVLAFLARTDRADRSSGDLTFRGLETGIRFVHVGFRYAANEQEILHDVSVDLPKGRVVALLGASGQGKTTIVKLLARLYDCTSGAILVDDVDLLRFDMRSWRARVAVVSQEPFLFHDTVMANLRFVRPEATDEAVRDAVRRASADHVIGRLREGYETVVGHRGARLSGGQRQLIALARAMLVEPDVLILDEATSQLDAESDAAVKRAIGDVRGRCVVLVVAHRMSTVRDADTIVVLDRGRVVEQGAPAELVARSGAYARMIAQQQPAPTATAPPGGR